MKITICKYNYDVGFNDKIPNYFSTHCSWYDTITLQGISDVGFPVFDEQGENPEKFYEFVSELFNTGVTLLDTTQSYRGQNSLSGGGTIKEFLFPDDNSNILLACEVDLDGRKLHGIINPETIECDINYVGKWMVSFAFASMETELLNYLKQIQVNPFGAYATTVSEEYRFENYMTNQIFGGISAHFDGINMDELNFSTFLYVSNPLQIRLHTNNMITRYDNFIAFAKWMGFVYKMEFTSETVSGSGVVVGWHFQLRLSFPTELVNRTPKTIDIIADSLLESYRIQNKEFVFIPTGKFLGDYQDSYNHGITGTAYYGCLINKSNVNVYDLTSGLPASHTQPFLMQENDYVQYEQDDTTEITSSDKINFMEVTYFEQDLITGTKWMYNPLVSLWQEAVGLELEITLGRMLVADWTYVIPVPPFTDESYTDEDIILAMTQYAGQQYGRLATGVNKQLKGKAVYDKDNPLIRFDCVEIEMDTGTRTFYASDITNLDLNDMSYNFTLQEVA